MGFFSRLKEKLGASSVTDEKRPEGVATVPPGHQVQVFGMVNTPPMLTQTPGNVFVASLGLGGDELPADVDAVLDALESRIASSPPSLLAAHAATVSELFAPADVEVHQALAVAWSVGADSTAHWFAQPDRLERQAARLQALGRDRQLPIVHAAYFLEDSPKARLVQAFFRGLGVGIRRPVADGFLVAEVARPEGVVISGLMGRPEAAPESQPPGAPGREAAEKLCREAAELLPGPNDPVDDATRIRRLILEEMDGKPSRLDEELLVRTRPFLVLADPQTGGIARQRWGDTWAIAAYSDLRSFHWAKQDMKIQDPTIAGMPARDLIRTAVSNQCGLAFNAYRDRSSPFYLLRSPADVAQLGSRL